MSQLFSGEFEGIEYTYTRRGEGEIVIMLPGTLGDENLFELIKLDNIELIVFNHIKGKTMSELVDAYHILFTKVLELDQFYLGGTSVGGWIAQHYSAKYPVKSLIISNSFSDNSILQKQSLKLFKITRFLPWFLIRSLFVKNVVNSLNSYGDSVVEYFSNSVRTLGKKRLRMILAWSLEDTKKKCKITSPISIIYTLDDSVVSRDITEILLKTYDAEIHVLDTGDHYPYRTRPESYSSVFNSIVNTNLDK